MESIDFRLYTFKVIRAITNLPLYTGGHWTAFVWSLLGTMANGHASLSDWDTILLPYDTGLRSYSPNDTAIFLLGTNSEVHEQVSSSLISIGNTSTFTGGHFVLNHSLEFIRCESAHRGNMEQALVNEAEWLSSQNSFTIRFVSPWRMKNPQHQFTTHRYIDPFIVSQWRETVKFFDTIHMDLSDASPSLPLQKSDGGIWVDSSWGSKCIGGFVGWLQFEGNLSFEKALQLCTLQYRGIGKNRSLGFGQFRIELPGHIRAISSPRRTSSLFNRILQVDRLKGGLPGILGEGGEDEIRTEELRLLDDNWFIQLSKDIENGTYSHSPYRTSTIPKENGGQRIIRIANGRDRIVQKCIASVLQEAFDSPDTPIFRPVAYAFRPGISRLDAAHKASSMLRAGMGYVLKGDIQSFFDSVPTENLLRIISCLLDGDPLVDIIALWLEQCRTWGIAGLPQGSPLSPLLSNLILCGVDRDVSTCCDIGFIRYADDFLLLGSQLETVQTGWQALEKSLGTIGLCLNDSKTRLYEPGDIVHYLGYGIHGDQIIDDSKVNHESWGDFHTEALLHGQTIYIGYGVRSVQTDGNDLRLIYADDSKQTLPWNSIRDIYLIGKAGFGSPLLFRSLKEEVPLIFLDGLGRLRGSLYPPHYHKEKYDLLQLEAVHQGRSLEFAREIALTKVHNSALFLQTQKLDPGPWKEQKNAILQADNCDSLRGHEGAYARHYFSEYRKLLSPFIFEGRIYHPPKGEINSILSFGYTLLYNRVSAVLSSSGFNPRNGFFHQGRGTHDALASDMMEGLRFSVDLLIIEMIREHNLTMADFEAATHDPSIKRLKGTAFRQFIISFESVLRRVRIWNDRDQLDLLEVIQRNTVALSAALKLGIPLKLEKLP